MSGHKIRSALTNILVRSMCVVYRHHLCAQKVWLFFCVCLCVSLALSQTLHRDEPRICRVIESRERAQFYRAMTRTSGGAGFYETSRCLVAVAMVMRRPGVVYVYINRFESGWLLWIFAPLIENVAIAQQWTLVELAVTHKTFRSIYIHINNMFVYEPYLGLDASARLQFSDFWMSGRTPLYCGEEMMRCTATSYRMLCAVQTHLFFVGRDSV